MKGYEIVLDHMIAKIRYEEYIKKGYHDDDTNMVMDLMMLKNNGMQDLNTKLFKEIDSDVSVGEPFGFTLDQVGIGEINTIIVYYADIVRNKLTAKCISKSIYYKYMMELSKKSERFVSPDSPDRRGSYE